LKEEKMSYEICEDYQQIYLLPPALEDFVPADHPARLIREFVDSLDLPGLGFKAREAGEGRPYYGESLLLKVWLYGYFNGTRSSRKLEKESKENMGLIWLTGMHYPDHNTLWRFYHRNRKALKSLFKEAVRVAVRGGLVGMVVNAVDGTKIMADVSQKSRINKKKLEEILRRIDESVDEVCTEIERAEEEERGEEYVLPQELQERKKLRAFVEEELKELKERGTSNLSKTDKDARMMKGNEGIRFAYNAQVVVDDKAGIIVGSEVEQSESDNSELVKMIDEVKENVGVNAQETTADGGYFSGEELKKAEGKGYEVLVNTTIKGDTIKTKDGEKTAFDRSKFRYDAARDVCVCPQGVELPYDGEKPQKGYRVKVYRCRRYKECLYRWECSKSKDGRKVGISPYHQAIEKQIKKQKQPDKEALLKRRKAIVEPMLGFIKHGTGFRRWTMRGLENVRSQWYLLCTSVNLRKMYKHWLNGEVQLA
jgi:transposase